MTINIDEFKIKLSQIYLSHFRIILDIKDFIINTVLAIRNFEKTRIRSEKSRYIRYPLEKIIQLDENLVLEMTHVKIFSVYEKFLNSYFYEMKKENKKFRDGYLTNINAFSKYLEDIFHLNIKYGLDCWNELIENYYRRNAFVHNRGKIGKEYIKKVKNCSPKERGKKLKMNLKYMKECISNILSFFHYILEQTIYFFNLENMEQILSGLNDERQYDINPSFFSRFSLSKAVI